jgi:hypothetical protein
MEFGTFVDRFFSQAWIVIWLGASLLLWVSAIKRVIVENWFAALWPAMGATIFTSAFLAANAIQVLGR